MRRLVGAATGAVVAVAALTACGPTMGDLPLPGTGVSGQTMTLQMDFADALNLATGATVKVNGVAEGKVESIKAADFQAHTTATVRTSAQLRQGATARLRYTTPLGELFVDVTNPATGPLLKNGATLTTAQTSTAPTVEDALSEASLLINGGGLGQLQQVTTELNAALGGNEGTIRDLLEQLNGFLTQANQTTQDIDTALNSLDSVSQTLAQRKATINKALTEIKPAADVLRSETPDFTALLQAVQQFAAQANDTAGKTKDQLLATIKEVQPVLAEMAANKGVWADSLDKLVALGRSVDQVIPGDWLNVSLDPLRVDPGHLLDTTGSNSPGGTPGGSPSSPSNPSPSVPGVPLPTGLPIVGGLLGGLLGGN
ncbi:MCE family protein [Nocardioides sp.]|jgi:phospholipid/cholesterol/gamma-HCH transport system substrate-binding protein|uniref:MCE family protein n=1 Tax=Nocardioides sp. TaxID=35761 RepID=UPI002CDDCC21|nr:MCE family protein [Nocardioides sp.]HVX54122.1 MCE family protein [Nocardioides sp.]